MYYVDPDNSTETCPVSTVYCLSLNTVIGEWPVEISGIKHHDSIAIKLARLGIKSRDSHEVKWPKRQREMKKRNKGYQAQRWSR